MEDYKPDNIRDLLEEAGVGATPVRILVYKSLYSSDNPLSLSDIEFRLETVDKSTISRTLNTFRKYHLVHSFDDGSGSVKYEVCRSTDHEHDSDIHVHFHCEKCGVTKCLSDVPVPLIKLPPGYQQHKLNYVVTGLCDNCSSQ